MSRYLGVTAFIPNKVIMKKAMKDCTGEEMLLEYLHQLLHNSGGRDCRADGDGHQCYSLSRVPYIDAQFQPRKMSVRPRCSGGFHQLAMISQFVEIPEDGIYGRISVRAARTQFIR